MRLRLIALPLAAASLFAVVPSAQAAYFPGQVIDAAPGLSAVQKADVAPDGSGAVAYLRNVGGVDHLFVVRLVNGGFLPPERVDSGVAEAASDAQIVAVDGGRLIVAWNAGGRLLVSARAASDAGWPAPAPVYDERAGGRRVSNLSLDASIFGVPYVAFTTTGAGGADVRCARVVGGRWTVDPERLDVNPAAAAGDGAAKHPDVAAAADGTALAVWGETAVDGRVHLFARRLTRRGVASTVRELSVASLNGRPSLGAGSPDAAMEFDSSYGWVAFRQTFNDGGPRSRVLARRLVASDFGAPVAVDGLGFPAAQGAMTPRLAIDGLGRGIVTSVREASLQTVGAIVRNDAFRLPVRIDSLANTGASFAVPTAFGSRALVAWQRAPGAGRPSEIRARRLATDSPEPEAVISRPELGPSAASLGLVDASDRAGDTVIAFLQGAAGARRLVAAVEDRPPGTPAVTTHSGWQNNPRPKIKWTPASDLWGSPTYRLNLAGLDIDRGTSTFFRPGADLPDGVYLYRVIATDRRGQARESHDRNLRVDTTEPTIFRIAPPVQAGQQVLLSLVDAAPAPPGVFPGPGSGIVLARISFGDGSPSVVTRRRSAPVRIDIPHVYERRGRFKASVRVADKAGNSARKRFVVKVGK